MREIKFRAWDGIRMSTSGIMFNSSTGHLELPRVQQMHLMQYTGLKDKNGVEIYSGDILSSENCSYYEKHNKPWVGCIVDDAYGGMSITYKEYVKDVFSLMSEPTNDAQTASWIKESCEVIGNIYEHSHLLNNVQLHEVV